MSRCLFFGHFTTGIGFLCTLSWEFVCKDERGFDDIGRRGFSKKVESNQADPSLVKLGVGERALSCDRQGLPLPFLDYLCRRYKDNLRVANWGTPNDWVLQGGNLLQLLRVKPDLEIHGGL